MYTCTVVHPGKYNVIFESLHPLRLIVILVRLVHHHQLSVPDEHEGQFVLNQLVLVWWSILSFGSCTSASDTHESWTCAVVAAG